MEPNLLWFTNGHKFSIKFIREVCLANIVSKLKKKHSKKISTSGEVRIVNCVGFVSLKATKNYCKNVSGPNFDFQLGDL